MASELLDYFQQIRLRGNLRRREWYWPKNAHRPKWFAYALEYEPFTLTLKVLQYVRRRRTLAPLTRSQRPGLGRISTEEIRIFAGPKFPNSFEIQMPGSVAATNGAQKPVDRPIRLPSGNRRLVVAHVYFEAEAKSIFDKLRPFTDYDQVITTSVPALRDAFLSQADPSRSACFLVPNAGRDVLPFLLAIHALDLSHYDRFIKIHTKRSAHLTHGETWFNVNIETFIGNKQMTDLLLDCIDPGRPSLYGVETLSVRDHFPNNRHWLQHLTGPTSGATRGRFIPGTMFAGSGQFLRELATLDLQLYQPEPESGQLDGTFVHALERLFGVFAQSRSGECATIESLVGDSVSGEGQSQP